MERSLRCEAKVEARVVAQLQQRPEAADVAVELARGLRVELRGAGGDAPPLPIFVVMLDVKRGHRARAARVHAELLRRAKPQRAAFDRHDVDVDAVDELL